MTRREFVTAATLAGVGLPLGAATAAVPALPEPSARKLPRWRGFNLLEKFIARRDGPSPAFREGDFALMAEWGFNFARLPLSYRCWAAGDPAAWLKLDESQLQQVDAAVNFGAKYGIHVNLNLHRAPGYCVNPPAEPLSLWRDSQALDAAAFHWAHFAKRYQGIPNSRLSFDLLNEPPDLPAATYERVVRAFVQAIRAVDPPRLIIADGLKWGREPLPGLADLGVAQSTRGYDPFFLTHYKANWVKDSEQKPVPTWPFREGDQVWDRDRLRRERIQPWLELAAKGVGVHVGEWGAYKFTPHAVTLAWMHDVLKLWQEAGWGWALWNFRGDFGPLNSARSDVTYEDYAGLKLDRAMLDLLRKY
jgi:endoglucanase